MSRAKIIWAAIAFVAAALAFFELPLPNTLTAVTAVLDKMDSWLFGYAKRPTLLAIVIGLVLGTVIIPEGWRLFRDRFFPRKPKDDLDATDAFDLILSRSKWAKRHVRNWKKLPEVMYETGKPEAKLIEDRLLAEFKRELYNVLRRGDITCWGHESTSSATTHLTPMKEIPAEKWDYIAIVFERPPYARYQTGHQSGVLAFVGLRFCRRQIETQFPMAWSARKS